MELISTFFLHLNQYRKDSSTKDVTAYFSHTMSPDYNSLLMSTIKTNTACCPSPPEFCLCVLGLDETPTPVHKSTNTSLGAYSHEKRNVH